MPLRALVPRKTQFSRSRKPAVGGDGARSLFNGKALAGQDRFADEEVSGLENHAVGRNQAARGEQHDVARHDLFQRHIDRAPVAKDAGLCAHTRLKGRRGGLCLVLARVSDAHRGEHDHDDDDGIDPLARQRRCRGGEDQHQQQRVSELIHQHPRPREALVLAHLVRSVLAQPSRSVCGRQAVRVLSQVAAPACRRQHSSSPSGGPSGIAAATRASRDSPRDPPTRQHGQPETQPSEQQRRREADRNGDAHHVQRPHRGRLEGAEPARDDADGSKHARRS